MSAAALYEAMGLGGYEVEGTWTGDEGILYVQVAVPREKLACRACGCSRVQRQGGQRRELGVGSAGSHAGRCRDEFAAREVFGLRSEDVASAEVCEWSAADHEDF